MNDRRLLRVRRAARYTWAAPCTAVGLLFAALVLLIGGAVRRRAGVLEAILPAARRRPLTGFGAITFGHVVLARSEEVLDRLRAHELEHVKQYERWGPAFFLAYPTSSLFQLLCGRGPYWSNRFEVQARARCAREDAGRSRPG